MATIDHYNKMVEKYNSLTAGTPYSSRMRTAVARQLRKMEKKLPDVGGAFTKKYNDWLKANTKKGG